MIEKIIVMPVIRKMKELIRGKLGSCLEEESQEPLLCFCYVG